MARKKPVHPLDTPDPVLVIGTRLRAWREKCGLTQVELAKEVGSVQATLSTYEAGSRVMKATMALRFARIFDITVDELLTTDP